MALGIYSSAAFTFSGSQVLLAPSATIEVRREDTGALASIFSDRAGTSTITNPSAFADATTGQFNFYAAGIEQGYSVKVTKDAFTYTLDNQAVGTAQEFDATTYTGSFLAAVNAAAARTVLAIDGQSRVIKAGDLAASALGFSLVNGGLSASVAGNALTIAIKGEDGNDPSATNPVYALFRDATAGSGDFTVLPIVAATSIVISSGSTLGTLNSTTFRFWVVGFNDAGTFRLGAINCLSGKNIFPLAGWGIASSTAEGGAGAADSAQVFYTGTAVTSKAYAVLGYLTYEGGLATAGTYASAPTRVQIFGPEVRLPGQVVQAVESLDGAVATGTTVLPLDDTIPQNTEGTQFMSLAITPSSGADLLRIEHQGYYATTSGSTSLFAALFQDSVAGALSVAGGGKDATANTRATVSLSHQMLAQVIASTTFKIRAGDPAAATVTFNGASSAREFGGTINSFLRLTEVMA